MNEIQKAQAARILSCYNIPTNDLEKAQENDLEKGGEGSRGGKIVGHTSTGKPIYDKFNHPAHANFTAAEHKEAAGGGQNREMKVNEADKHFRAYRAKEEDEKAAKNVKVGKTQSGKDVYEGTSHSAHADFSKQDHLDASKIFKEKSEKHQQERDKHERGSAAFEENHNKYQEYADTASKHFHLAKKKEGEGTKDTKSKEFYDKHKNKILSHLEDYSMENHSASEAAQKAGWSEERADEEADGTAHGDYADSRAGDYESYKKHHDEIHENIGHKLPKD